MHVLNILWVVFGIGLMLVLNLKFKINSMVALLVAALSVGMLAGMDLMSLLHTMKAGFGNTLGELAIIVVFGAVIGKLMVDSGAAHQIAHTLLARLGLRYVQLSVIIIGLIFGLAMFYEVAFIMLAPLVIVIAAEAKIPFLKLAIPAVAAATTAFTVPTAAGSCGAGECLWRRYGDGLYLWRTGDDPKCNLRRSDPAEVPRQS